MATLRVYDSTGALTGATVEVDDAVFDVEGSERVVHQAVTTHLANRRQGTHKTKERAEVRGGGRKPWRQKGTGRARAGTIRAPQWKGGGTVFGPRPRDHGRRMPAKVSRRARIAALSAKYRAESIFATDQVRPLEPKTRLVADLLRAMEMADRRVLWLVAEGDANLRLSTRNIPGCRTLLATDVNVYDIVKADVVLIEKEAIPPLQEMLTR